MAVWFRDCLGSSRSFGKLGLKNWILLPSFFLKKSLQVEGSFQG